MQGAIKPSDVGIFKPMIKILKEVQYMPHRDKRVVEGREKGRTTEQRDIPV